MPPEVFLHGPFAEYGFLSLVLGEAPAVAPAALEGYAVRVAGFGRGAVLAPTPDDRAVGVNVRLDPADFGRLDFVMAALGQTRSVMPDGRAAYLGTGGRAPWDAAERPAVEAHHLAEVAAEILGHYSHRDLAEMPEILHGITLRALARVRGRTMRPPSAVRSELSGADVELIEMRLPYAGYFGIEEHTLRHRRFDGGLSPVMHRAVFTSGDAVTVLPFDPARRTILLIEQFRMGVYARRDPAPWCIEAVAGRSDALETPEETARREALEEAGLVLGRIERIAGYYPSPGTVAEYITAFVGEAELDIAGGLHGLEAEAEDIRAMVVPLDEAVALTETGEINNAPLIISVLWLARHEARLREAWSRGAAGEG